ncbi:cupin domain-containing protein [Henriciella aquimarina]|uniref:cupin domain-containing protein n=1 Tax=Henriciella aquimarina TaxID=545261 RepID=UPI001F461B2D|nr:cupin domain-containing protein [Henriciella aquimarina]
MAEQTEGGFGLRRIVTGETEEGRSRILIDGPQAAEFRTGELGGLFEIWTDATSGAIETTDEADRGIGKPQLSPPKGGVKIRWFAIEPAPDGVPAEQVREITRAAFVEMGAGDHQPDTSRHPAMHKTDTLDAIILVKGRVRLLLDDDETVLEPGDVVVQRATNHAWVAEGNQPALFVAVLVDRS